MKEPVSDEVLDQLFRAARTYTAWLDRPVSDETLRRVYELMKWGPTSANCCPVRIVFLRTPEAKRRLLPALSANNVTKTMTAPVTAILAYDPKFYELLPRLFPHQPAARGWFATSPELAQATAFRNGSLEGAYFILAARAMGLDCGPMSGFDNAKVDQEFFAGQEAPGEGEGAAPSGGVESGSPPAGGWKSNFLCNLGYGDPASLMPRGPRLDFEEVCRLL